MRRLALLGLLLLSGCQGTGTFLGDTFSFSGRRSERAGGR